MEITVKSLQRLAWDGNMVGIVVESYTGYGYMRLEYVEDDVIKFHVNSKIILLGNNGAPFTTITKLQNMFEKAYQDFHLEVESLIDNQCIFVVRKNDIDSLKLSEDYKLVTKKMRDVSETRKLVEETKDIQKESATRINDLFKKLAEVKDYVDKLQLKEENEKKVSEQLDTINSDIQELEIRLKKDIPELDKSLDINNFR